MGALMDPLLMMPQVDCDCAIGKELYQFYFPLEIGDFVLNIWTRPHVVDTFALTIFENGSRISHRDRRFSPSNCSWSSKLFKSGAEEVFSRKEIDGIIIDLAKFA
jgi:hypothetical protein